MNKDSAVNAITRFKVQKSDRSDVQTDQIVSEEPLEIRIDSGSGDSRLAITMRTPGNDLELAAGFLWSEGLLRNREDLVSITSCKDHSLSERERENIVVCHVTKDAPAITRELERRFTISSACGICGTDQIDDLKNRGCTHLEKPKLAIEELAKLPDQMRTRQNIFDKTGGLHAAALFDENGNLKVIREDVGRHNAVDKVIGWALIQNLIPLTDWSLTISGRGGFEIVQKSVAAGLSAMISVSAPTSLAVETAREFNLTLLGFARDGKATIYSPDPGN
ncbi:MAG: formate dehydrogenase accessory sulfurtransferase FdhD [Candidatus Nanopelagicales bacterium]